jgi:C1A family cysteine protease
MRRRLFPAIASTAVLAAVALGTGLLPSYGEQAAPESRPSGSQTQTEVFRSFDIDGRPMVRLRTGEEYPVLPLSPEQKQHAAMEAARKASMPEPSREPGGGAYASATPDTVDHRRFHGPIRNQGERGTCGAFATTAAVEGFYHRVNPSRYGNLKLSEQWTNYVHMMSDLRDAPTSAAYRENAMGCWGNARPYYELLALELYGLPTEGTLGYNPDPGLERIGDPNDAKTLQWTVDNYNLDANNLPLSALTSSPYRPTGVELVVPDALHRSGDVEAVLAAGYDVVALMGVVSPMYTNAVKAWVAGADSQVSFQHIVLIVGYNRPGRYYIVRNSWGGSDGVDGGYTRISYDYLAQYGIYGSYVTGVADPEQEGTQGRQYLGRWEIAQWNGALDIYRLPGLYTLGYDHQKDYRIGTYYENGQAWRVNGYWWNGELAFCIDFDHPNAGRDALAGNWYAATVFSFKDDTLFGFAYRDGWVEAFLGARKMRTF